MTRLSSSPTELGPIKEIKREAGMSIAPSLVNNLNVPTHSLTLVYNIEIQYLVIYSMMLNLNSSKKLFKHET